MLAFVDYVVFFSTNEAIDTTVQSRLSGQSRGYGYWEMFLEGPKSVRTRKAVAKSQTFMITELFYSHIPYTNRGSLHTKSFRRYIFLPLNIDNR